jgi:iron complex outermembrane receptor protein
MPRTFRARALLLSSAALASALAFGGAASAQDDTTVEEVVVTAPNYVPTTNTSATKLNIPLIETPQSITVITRDQIDLQNWTNLQQAVRYTSGVIGENFGSDERYDWITQRGFQPVQYIDGLQAPIGSVTNVGLDLWGADSIEILKGPSGVLYGQTPPGGIVNLTMRRPQSEFGGELQAQYGSYDHKQLAGDVTGSLNEMFSARLTGLWRDRETQTDGVTSKRAYIAPAFTIKFTPDTELTFLSYYQDDEVDGDGAASFRPTGPSCPTRSVRFPPSATSATIITTFSTAPSGAWATSSPTASATCSAFTRT